MQKKQLRKFILVSVALHVILITAILLYLFKPSQTGGKVGTVLVGIINSKDINQDKSSTLSSTDESKLTSNEVTKPKIALEKKPVKETIHKQKNTQKNKQKTVVKTTGVKANSSAKKASNLKLTKDTKKNGHELSSNISTVKPNSGQDQAKAIAGINTELAYPDYNLNPKPRYPRVARKRGYEGEVKLKVLVLENGKVGQIEIIRPSGYEVLDDSALEAVKNWVFVPGRENGKEISSWVTVPITFQLKSG